MRLRRLRRRCCALAPIFLLGCESNVVDPRPDPWVCSAAWQTVYSPEQTPGGQLDAEMKWHAGRLYFNDWTSDDVRSVATDGGPARIELPDTRSYWIEGEQLLFRQLYQRDGQSNEGLYARPLAGGDAQMVLDPATGGVWSTNWLLDASALYGRSGLLDRAAVWRVARGDGARSVLADLEGTLVLKSMFLGGPDLLLESFDATAPLWRLPKEGGVPAQLPAPPDMRENTPVGISESGEVLWSSTNNSATFPADDDCSMFRSSGTAPPERFWATKPRAACAARALPDGVGGWYVVAREAGTDESGRHLTVWSVDATGRGTRLACDPIIGREVITAAVGDDAVYLMVEYLFNRYWEIVSVPLY